LVFDSDPGGFAVRRGNEYIIIEITELMDVKVKLEEILDVVENMVTLLLIATIMNLGSM
jgi:hypothetical protein